MFRYPYQEVGPGNPPAAFVFVNVEANTPGTWVENLPAIADTGADQTVLPDHVIERLGLVPLELVEATGYGGEPVYRPTYYVRLLVRDLPPVELIVLGGWPEPYAIIGRDVLNRYRAVFDGPNLRLEIG